MLERRIVRGVKVSDRTPRQVAREFHALLDRGARILPAGRAKRDPLRLLSEGHGPRYRLQLFDTVFYLAELRQEPNARFFIAYVLQDATSLRSTQGRVLYPRYFYKDASLVWRSASHFARSHAENWIGKGDLKPVMEDGEVVLYTAEETTNLPFEIQRALDDLSRRPKRVITDDEAIGLVLRRARDDRVEPYDDFTAERRAAASDPRNRVHGGKPVAWFERPRDPGSLRFVRGYEPDVIGGRIETGRSTSRLYGGLVRKFRVLSKNREIQYLFLATPESVWLVPPQTLTTQLSTFGVRTVDVEAPDDLFVPGYEYHYLDETEDPPRMYSQIPEGFAGGISAVDPARADASPWLDRLPVVRAFRRAIRYPSRKPTRRPK